MYFMDLNGIYIYKYHHSGDSVRWFNTRCFPSGRKKVVETPGVSMSVKNICGFFPSRHIPVFRIPIRLQFKGYLRWNLMSTMGFWGTLFKTHRFSFGSPNSLRKKCPVGSPIAGGKDPGFQASIKQKLSEWHIGEWP